ncbi:hypothetical protein BG003_007586 [Podila horticola]|nr:hypothetical protein BG003_007586 [Podila horticola]
MYRDSSFSGDYEDTTQSGTSFAAAGRPQPFQERLNQVTDNKFRSRAYEPSPLANPQLAASMGLGNMSLGEMFGFPSAKFQAPENHFAHRSITKANQKGSDPWSYRRDSVSDQDDDLPGSALKPRYPGVGTDLDDDDEDDKTLFKSYSGHDDVFSRFSSMDTSGSRSGLTFDGREAFAAQTYFPPEPETGLEDNFLGVVKIVDDYLPQSQTPRTIAGRNLMMKKHKALYWLAAILLCRVVLALEIDHWVWSPLQMLVKALFVCAILHATVFWIVVEYQTSKRPSKEKPVDKKRTSKAQDPFEPTTSDKVISDIGARGVKVLCKVLQQDYMDVDICKAVLEILTILCQADPNQEDSQDFALDMSKAILDDTGNVATLLDILEEYDFYVRFHVVSLLALLVLNDTPRLQECILTSPVGMSRLMALLDDRREIIRNEGLLLLISLTESNADLQKIVAFENAFERLLAIIDEEGALTGGIIVQDCLQLVQNLLRHNVSNQNYFRETSCIQRIPELFNSDTIDEHGKHDPSMKDVWSDQKGNNMIMVLELIRVLVVPDHSNTVANQKSMFQCGILPLLVDLSLSSNAPQRVKASALYALAELIRLSKVNQESLSKSVIIPAHPPPVIDEEASTGHTPPSRTSAQINRSSFQSGRGSTQVNLGPRAKCPAIVEVVAIAVGVYPGCTYSVRAAATCLFQGWQEDSEDSVTDPYNSWFATVLFSHILQNNPRAKGIAMAITFGDEENGEDPVSLIHAITAALMVAVKGHADVRVALGYLALLCIWCYESPKSIKEFLSEGAHLQFLIELISPGSKEDPMVQGLAAFLLGICYEFNWEADALISRATIQPIILSRIGLDHFAACITRVRESKPFKAAVPYMVVLPSEEGAGKLPGLFFDYSFVEFMKRNFERTQKSISVSPENTQSGRPSQPLLANAETDSMIKSLRAKTTAQDAEIADLKAQLAEAAHLKAQVTETAHLKAQLVETAHLKAQVAEISHLKTQLAEAQQQLMRKAREQDEYEYALAGLRQEIQLGRERHESLEKEHEDLLICLAEQDVEMNNLKEHMLSLGISL